MCVPPATCPLDDATPCASPPREHGWGVVFDDPGPDEDVPSCSSSRAGCSPCARVFDFLHIYPGYREADIGWVFLAFFSLFFAMIVGDAGYGALLSPHGGPAGRLKRCRAPSST